MEKLNFSQADQRKVRAVLKTLLPRLSPDERLKLLAEHAGHETYDDMVAWNEDREMDKRVLSERAATGRVLPILVVVGLITCKPQGSKDYTCADAGTILRNAKFYLDKAAFDEALIQPMGGANVAPEGACRWFFAVIATDALFDDDENIKLWQTRCRRFLGSIMVLSDHFITDRIEEGLIKELARTYVASRWEFDASKALDDMQREAVNDLSSLVATSNRELRLRSVIGRQEHDPGIGFGEDCDFE